MNWQAHLAPGEALLWEGRPDPSVQPSEFVMEPWRKIALTILLGGLTLLLLLAIGPKLWGFPLYMAGLMIFAAALIGGLWYFLYGKPSVDAFWRRRMWYALTSRRALTATRALGREWLSAYKLKPGREVTWTGADPGHVIFHTFTGRGQFGTNHYVQGFRFIADGGAVKRLAEEALAKLEDTGSA